MFSRTVSDLFHSPLRFVCKENNIQSLQQIPYMAQSSRNEPAVTGWRKRLISLEPCGRTIKDRSRIDAHKAVQAESCPTEFWWISIITDGRHPSEPVSATNNLLSKVVSLPCHLRNSQPRANRITSRHVFSAEAVFHFQALWIDFMAMFSGRPPPFGPWHQIFMCASEF